MLQLHSSFLLHSSTQGYRILIRSFYRLNDIPLESLESDALPSIEARPQERYPDIVEDLHCLELYIYRDQQQERTRAFDCFDRD